MGDPAQAHTPPAERAELYPLFGALPQLRARAPVAGLLPAATPIEPLAGATQVSVKRDDLSAPDFGGNKVRKLDFLLASARAAGCRELLTFGYAGSNFVAATAWHGSKLGLGVVAYLLPQAPAAYVADNLAVSLHCGAALQLCDSSRLAVTAAVAHSARSLLKHGQLPKWIPPGGSSPRGALGFVNAALELRDQIAAGLTPAPARLYCAFSSMGTVAGLGIGLALAGLPTQIVAVRVVDRAFANREKLAGLVAATLHWLGGRQAGLPDAAAVLERIAIRDEFFGEGYAQSTASTHAAIQRFERATGARADSAYTGKALACLFSDLDARALRGAPTLYWHTFNAHGRPPGVALPDIADVPEPLRPYLGSLPTS